MEPGWPSWVPTGAPHPEVTVNGRVRQPWPEKGVISNVADPSVGGLGYTARSASKGGIWERGELRVEGGRARLPLRPRGQVQPREAQFTPHPPSSKLPARHEGAGGPRGACARRESAAPWR